MADWESLEEGDNSSIPPPRAVPPAPVPIPPTAQTPAQVQPQSTALIPRVDDYIRGQVSQFVDPNPQQPAQSMRQFAGNAWGDLKSLATGVGVMGSVSAQRTIDTYMPKGVYQPELLDRDLVDALTPRGFLQPGDAEVGAKIAVGIVDHYKTKFVDPLLKGDFKTPWNYFLSNPVMATSDVAPLGGPVGKLAGRAAQATGVAARLETAGAAIANTARSAPIIGNVIQNVEATNAVNRLLNSANARFLGDFSQEMREIQEIYGRIPRDVRSQLYEAGEYTNPELYHDLIARHPEVGEFLRRSNELSNRVADRLMQSGAMTEQQFVLAKYGPATMARHGIERAEELLSANGQIDPRVLAMRAEMQAAGVEPVYFRNVSESVSRSSGRLQGSLYGKTREQLQVQRYDPSRNEMVESFQRSRMGETLDATTRGDAFANMRGGVLEGLSFLHLRDLFTELMAHPQVAGRGGFEVVNVRNFMRQASNAAGLEPAAQAGLLEQLPDSVRLPLQAAHALNSAMRDYKWAFWDQIGNAQKHVMLGTNPAWAANQFIQNLMISGAAMFKSPRDIAASLMAYALAFNRDITRRLPAHWTQEIAETSSFGEHTARNAADLMPHLQGLGLTRGAQPLANSMATIGAAYQWTTERVFKLAAQGDNYARVVKGLHTVMREVEAADPATRVAFTDAFDIMARSMQIEQGLGNAAVLEEAGRDILRWYGDYSALASRQTWLQRKFLPFYLWNRHAASIALALPSQSPIKNALMNQLYVLAPEVFQDKDMPEAYRRLGAIKIPGKGPNGGELYRSATGATPFQMSFDMLRHIGSASGMDLGGEGGVGSALHAIPSEMILFTGHNPSNFQTIRNPHLIQQGGEQFVRQPDGSLEKVNWSALPIQNQVARTFAPPFERYARQAIAYPYAPTDYTTLGDRAINRSQKHPEGKVNWDMVRLMIGNTTKTLPLEGGMSVGEEEIMHNAQQQKLRRAAMRQSFRTDKD